MITKGGKLTSREKGEMCAVGKTDGDAVSREGGGDHFFGTTA